MTALLLGPGTAITHAAIRALAENGCLAIWTGEEAVRVYAQGLGETRSSRRLVHQARLMSNSATRLQVVRRMYELRFSEPVDAALTLEQLRGREGIRVRRAYQTASRETGVPWSGRSYRREAWGETDPVNRALSVANSCLYGVCHAAIISAGYSPALGFIHTGNMLSFVHDVADLYKADVTIPLAFREAASSAPHLDTRVRYACRDMFRESKLLQRIVPDIDRVLDVGPEEGDEEPQGPSGLWDPSGAVRDGVNWADPPEERAL